MNKKFPYRRGQKLRNPKNISINVGDHVLEIPKDNLLFKAILLEARLWEIAKNEEEALLIAELLTVSSKEPFL
ncbi:TPA: hypothetical protein ACGBG5_003557 [Enterococcus faecalis]